MLFNEFDVVIIASNRIPGVPKGSKATVLEVYGEGAYEIEIKISDREYKQYVYFEDELEALSDR